MAIYTVKLKRQPKEGDIVKIVGKSSTPNCVNSLDPQLFFVQCLILA